jgi:hypothetical protein
MQNFKMKEYMQFTISNWYSPLKVHIENYMWRSRRVVVTTVVYRTGTIENASL